MSYSYKINLFIYNKFVYIYSDFIYIYIVIRTFT